MIASKMHEIRFDVEELACNYCTRRLFDGLSAIDGVVAVHIQPPPERLDGPDDVWGTVVVKFVPEVLGSEEIYDRVRHLGYSLRKTPEG